MVWAPPVDGWLAGYGRGITFSSRWSYKAVNSASIFLDASDGVDVGVWMTYNRRTVRGPMGYSHRIHDRVVMEGAVLLLVGTLVGCSLPAPPSRVLYQQGRMVVQLETDPSAGGMEHAAGRAPAGAVGHSPARRPDQERAGVVGVLAQPVPSVRAGLRRRRSGAAGADSRRWTHTGWRGGTPRLHALEPSTGTPPCPDIRSCCDQGILSPVRID